MWNTFLISKYCVMDMRGRSQHQLQRAHGKMSRRTGMRCAISCPLKMLSFPNSAVQAAQHYFGISIWYTDLNDKWMSYKIAEWWYNLRSHRYYHCKNKLESCQTHAILSIDMYHSCHFDTWNVQMVVGRATAELPRTLEIYPFERAHEYTLKFKHHPFTVIGCTAMLSLCYILESEAACFQSGVKQALLNWRHSSIVIQSPGASGLKCTAIKCL